MAPSEGHGALLAVRKVKESPYEEAKREVDGKAKETLVTAMRRLLLLFLVLLVVVYHHVASQHIYDDAFAIRRHH